MATPHGETNRIVAENVARLRAERRWSLRELAERLPKGAGWIGHSGIRSLEANERAASVDNLTALAAVFDVSPVALLMPYVPSDEGLQVHLTGTPTVEVSGLLGWLQGTHPIHLEDIGDSYLEEGFRRRSLPDWAR